MLAVVNSKANVIAKIFFIVIRFNNEIIIFTANIRTISNNMTVFGKNIHFVTKYPLPTTENGFIESCWDST